MLGVCRRVSTAKVMRCFQCCLVSACFRNVRSQHAFSRALHWAVDTLKTCCSTLCQTFSAKLHYTDTDYAHVVQHHQRTSSQQFYNLLYTTNSPPTTDKNLPHHNIAILACVCLTQREHVTDAAQTDGQTDIPTTANTSLCRVRYVDPL